MLAAALSARGIRSVGLGSRKAKLFGTDPEVAVFLLNAAEAASATGAGAAGLNLTAANHVVLLDVLQDAELERQTVGRVCRIGQAKRTTVWHLLGLDSIDQPLRLQADRAQLLGGESSGDAAASASGVRKGKEKAAPAKEEAAAASSASAPVAAPTAEVVGSTEAVVGSKVKVWWPGVACCDRQRTAASLSFWKNKGFCCANHERYVQEGWYKGRVTQSSPARGLYVVYDDGDEEWVHPKSGKKLVPLSQSALKRKAERSAEPPPPAKRAADGAPPADDAPAAAGPSSPAPGSKAAGKRKAGSPAPAPSPSTQGKSQGKQRAPPPPPAPPPAPPAAVAEVAAKGPGCSKCRWKGCSACRARASAA
eukprot:Transcript_4783.p2 GENE.Transcript_4783~~Transcript_4783.p2  ORF type:complete len:365 (-),score=129.08 Transcript_4783:809-1903(-)